MLKQGIIKIGSAVGFIDQHSEKCNDGKGCDNNGDLVWCVDGEIIRERDFKEYRKFSPQFRRVMIEEYFIDNNKSVTSCSCSCSKCGTTAIDEAFWW